MSEPDERPSGTAVPPPPPPPPAPEPPVAAPGPTGWGAAPQAPPGYGPPAPTQPQHGAPQHGAPQYGQPQYGQPQYGQPQHGAPQYGQPQYGQPQYGQPQYGQPQYGQQPGAGQYGSQYSAGAPAPGQAPGAPLPVQRGIVPLRPLGLGEILDGSFRAIRANPRVMFGFSAVVVTLSVLVTTVMQWYSFSFLGETLSAPVDQQAEMVVGDIAGLAGGTALSVVVTLVATTLLTGLLIVSVSRSVIGQKLSVGEAWAHARPQLWRLLLLTLLVVGLMLSVPAVWVGAGVAAALAEQWGLLVAVVLVGGLGVLVWTVWISVRTLLSTPALMLEEQRVIAGLRRGWALSRGSFWRLLGIYLLVSVIVGTVASIIVAPVSILPTILELDPLNDPRALAISAVGSIVASILTTPVTAAVVALLYIDVRIRREGLDVELARAAEASADSSRA